MNNLSSDNIEAIIQKVLSKDGRTIKEIATLNNISESTIYKWLKRYRDGGTINKFVRKHKSHNLTLSEQFQHLVATSSLDEAAVGVYCRKHGLFSFQLKQWEETFVSQKSDEKNQGIGAELKILREENKQLKREVRRKDTALSEVVALLVLKKKADLIWGESEDV